MDVLVEQLRKTYPLAGGDPLVAVDDVDLQVPAGQVVALVGPSGSGKSTLLHLLGGLDRPTSGTVRVGGTDFGALPRRALPAYRRTVGFVFQQFHLLPALSALDNVMAPLLPVRASRRGPSKADRARAALAAVGLADRERSLPSRLSGGQQQRVAIARALATAPGLLLADEPTGNLDRKTGQEIVDLLLRLRDERGTTVLLATHDAAVAARCDRVVRLRDGAVLDDVDVSSGTPVEVTAGRLDRVLGA